MSNADTSSCRTISWIVAVVLAILAFACARGWLDWGFFWSLVAAVVVFFVAGYFLVRMLCAGEAASQPAAPASKAAPAPKPAAPVAAPKPAPEPEPKPEPAPEPAASDAVEGSKPAALAGPRDGQADDLKMIKGVGPALEKLLNEMGIWHFDQIAVWSSSELAWVDDNLLRFKGRASRDNWIDQARKLALGGETEFSNRVEDGDVY